MGTDLITRGYWVTLPRGHQVTLTRGDTNPANDNNQVSLLLHNDCFEPTLEQVTNLHVMPIECLRPCVSVALFVINVPTECFEERIDKFRTQLCFVVLRRTT